MRTCDLCGAKQAPYEPRKKVNGLMLCRACAKKPGSGMVSATAVTAAKGYSSDDYDDGWFADGLMPDGYHALNAPLPVQLYEHAALKRQEMSTESLSRSLRRSKPTSRKIPRHAVKRQHQALHKQAHQGNHYVEPVLKGNHWEPDAERMHVKMHHGHTGKGSAQHIHDYHLDQHTLAPGKLSEIGTIDSTHTHFSPKNFPHNYPDISHHGVGQSGYPQPEQPQSEYIPEPASLDALISHLHATHGMTPEETGLEGTNLSQLHDVTHNQTSLADDHHHEKQTYLDHAVEEAEIKAEANMPLPNNSHDLLNHLIDHHGEDSPHLNDVDTEYLAGVHNTHHDVLSQHLGWSEHPDDENYDPSYAEGHDYGHGEGTSDHNHEQLGPKVLPGNTSANDLKKHLQDEHLYDYIPDHWNAGTLQHKHDQAHAMEGSSADESHTHSEPDSAWQASEMDHHLIGSHGWSLSQAMSSGSGPADLEVWHNQLHNQDSASDAPSLSHSYGDETALAPHPVKTTHPEGGRESESLPGSVLPPTSNKQEVIDHLNLHHPEVGSEAYDASPYHTNGGGLQGWHEALHDDTSEHNQSYPQPQDNHEHGAPAKQQQLGIAIGSHLVSDHGLTQEQVVAMTPSQFHAAHQHDHQENDEKQIGHGHLFPGGPTREPRDGFPNMVHSEANPGHPAATEWYHGTSKHFEGGPDTATVIPDSNYGSGDWNCHAGGHWSSLHSVAQSFGSGGRVIHGKLKMKNPRIYNSALHMAHDAYDRLRALGEITDDRYDNNHTGRGYGGCCSGVLASYANGNTSVRKDNKKGLQKYRDSLRASGFDGIIYHNHADGPNGHPCAITFHPNDVEVLHDNCRNRSVEQDAAGGRPVDDPRYADDVLWNSNKAPGESNYVKDSDLPKDVSNVDRSALRDEDVERNASSPYYDSNINEDEDGQYHDSDDDYCEHCDMNGHDTDDDHCPDCGDYGHGEGEHWSYCPACMENNPHGNDPKQNHTHCDYCEKQNGHGWGDHETNDHEDEFGEHPEDFKDEDTCPHCGLTSKKLRGRDTCLPQKGNGGTFDSDGKWVHDPESGCGQPLPDWKMIHDYGKPTAGQTSLYAGHEAQFNHHDALHEHLAFDHGVDAPGKVFDSDGNLVHSTMLKAQHLKLHNVQAAGDPGHEHADDPNFKKLPVPDDEMLAVHMYHHHTKLVEADDLAATHEMAHSPGVPSGWLPYHSHADVEQPQALDADQKPSVDDLDFHLKHFHQPYGKALTDLTPDELEAHHNEYHLADEFGFSPQHVHEGGGDPKFTQPYHPDMDDFVELAKAQDHLHDAHGKMGKPAPTANAQSIEQWHLNAHSESNAEHFHPTGDGKSQFEYNPFNHLVTEHGTDPSALHNKNVSSYHVMLHNVHGNDKGEWIFKGVAHHHHGEPEEMVKPEPAEGVNPSLHSHLYDSHGYSPDDLEGESNSALISQHKAMHGSKMPDYLVPGHKHAAEDTALLHTKKKSDFGKKYTPEIADPSSHQMMMKHVQEHHGVPHLSDDYWSFQNGTWLDAKDKHEAMHEHEVGDLKHKHPEPPPLDKPLDATDTNTIVHHLNHAHNGDYSGSAEDAKFYDDEHTSLHKEEYGKNTGYTKPHDHGTPKKWAPVNKESEQDSEDALFNPALAEHLNKYHNEDNQGVAPWEHELMQTKNKDLLSQHAWAHTESNVNHTHDDKGTTLLPPFGHASHLINGHGINKMHIPEGYDDQKQMHDNAHHGGLYSGNPHEHFADQAKHLKEMHGWNNLDLKGKNELNFHHDHNHTHSKQWAEDNSLTPVDHTHQPDGSLTPSNLHQDAKDLAKHMADGHGIPEEDVHEIGYSDLDAGHNLIHEMGSSHTHDGPSWEKNSMKTAAQDHKIKVVLHPRHSENNKNHFDVHQPVCTGCGWEGSMRGTELQATRSGKAHVREQMRTRVATKVWLIHDAGIKVVAHDSGDSEILYHCPFCGSGNVIARSDGTTECEFCHSAFTVQVQPEFSAFPQTINGMPVDIPGMPGEIDQGAGPIEPDDVSEDGEVPGLDDAADADGVADDSSDGGGGFAGKPSAENQPPWLAKKAVYVTTRGAVLDEDDFIAHLALSVADKSVRPMVLAGVRTRGH